MTMRAFYQSFERFQTTMLGNPHCKQVSNAGPLWMCECDSPMNTQAIRDQAANFVQTQAMQCAVLRGKSAISEAKQRVCIGTSESIHRVWNIEKGKGKGAEKRVQVCWPDMKNCWRAVADGFNLVAGEMNLEEMRYDVEISQLNCGSAEQAQTLATSMRQWEHTDRLGYFLPLQINIVADLNGCTFGREPKGLGKGQGAAQRQTFAGGQQQQQQQLQHGKGQRARSSSSWDIQPAWTRPLASHWPMERRPGSRITGSSSTEPRPWPDSTTIQLWHCSSDTDSNQDRVHDCRWHKDRTRADSRVGELGSREF
jgi:hypothetical protein